MILYHITTKENAKNIIENGFNFEKENMRPFGEGVSLTPKTSISYWTSAFEMTGAIDKHNYCALKVEIEANLYLSTVITGMDKENKLIDHIVKEIKKQNIDPITSDGMAKCGMLHKEFCKINNYDGIFFQKGYYYKPANETFIQSEEVILYNLNTIKNIEIYKER
ncbi:MAG: hypothetical protein ACRDBY_11080 [Cetobacterium sp.]